MICTNLCSVFMIEWYNRVDSIIGTGGAVNPCGGRG